MAEKKIYSTHLFPSSIPLGFFPGQRGCGGMRGGRGGGGGGGVDDDLLFSSLTDSRDLTQLSAPSPPIQVPCLYFRLSSRHRNMERT